VSNLTHLGGAGRVKMVDVGDKPITQRRALASGYILTREATLNLVVEGKAPKGSVITTAEIAGIMGAKKTAELIPLCHPLPLTKVSMTITPDTSLPGFRVEAEARTAGQTGIEMEALTSVSIACLTLYDMMKAVDKTMTIGGIKLMSKSGGKSGDWTVEQG